MARSSFTDAVHAIAAQVDADPTGFIDETGNITDISELIAFLQDCADQQRIQLQEECDAVNERIAELESDLLDEGENEAGAM